MYLEVINKWLDEEYGCSYTRLEELHDFYFEKYSDLKQENKQLKSIIYELREYMLDNHYKMGWEYVEYLDRLLPEINLKGDIR